MSSPYYSDSGDAVQARHASAGRANIPGLLSGKLDCCISHVSSWKADPSVVNTLDTHQTRHAAKAFNILTRAQ